MLERTWTTYTIDGRLSGQSQTFIDLSIIQYSVWGHFSVLNVWGWVWEVFNKIETLPSLSLHLSVKDWLYTSKNEWSIGKFSYRTFQCIIRCQEPTGREMLAEICEARNLPSRGKDNIGSFLLIISPLLFLECRLSWDKTGPNWLGIMKRCMMRRDFCSIKAFVKNMLLEWTSSRW